MARRYSEAEKGKGQLTETPNQTIKRIKAPYLDTTHLIKENALTLIGRLTNPQEQRMWALLPALPRKWNLQGRAVGSDLGNNCFQYRFERADDLQRVLDNIPYHFSYWMVILQKWEPVISSSFPSQIPFWIRIQGLPLHYWHDDMVCNVGKELGTLENHVLTKTSAKVRVLINGLKPLIKESIIELESGEETLITLEYQPLENHYSSCGSLFHLKNNCPELVEEQNSSQRSPREQTTVMKPLTSPIKRSSYSMRAPDNSNARKEKEIFQERVDRHGNSFGVRVTTKQTRNPPPERY